jgi:hypothetical protein
VVLRRADHLEDGQEDWNLNNTTHAADESAPYNNDTDAYENPAG